MREDAQNSVEDEPVEGNNVAEDAAQDTASSADNDENDAASSEEGPVQAQAKYSRNYLMQFQEMFKEKPDCLPNIEIIKGFEGVPEKSGGRQGKGGGGGKGKGNRDRNSRSKGKGGGKGRRERSRDPGPAFTGPVAPLEVSANRWAKKVETDELKKLSSDVLAILNKITPEKFDVLFAKLLELDFNTPEALEKVIDCIFDKALGEPAFCPLYSMLCARLNQDLPEMEAEEDGKPAISFRRLLLNKCQQEFEQESNIAEEEDEQLKGKMKRRMLGNIKFIGELYLKRMLMDKIMFFCMHKLVTAAEPDEEDIEALCNLLTTIGADIEATPRGKDPLDSTFSRLKQLKEAKPPVLQSRIRFMIQDLFDLRESRWHSRNATDAPTTLANVKASKQENPHDAAARKARGRPAAVQAPRARDRNNKSGSRNPSPQGESDGWAVAGQKPKGGPPSPKDEWAVAGGGNNRRGAPQQDARRGGKGGGKGRPDVRQDARQQQPKPKPAKIASTNVFALMPDSEESEEDEDEDEDEATPVAAAVVMDSELFKKKLGSIVDEYLASSDEKEACACFKELDASEELMSTLALEAVLHVMEKKAEDRTKVDGLLVHLCKSSTASEAHMVAGISSLMDVVPDMAMDVPKFGQYVANTLANLVAKEAVKPAEIAALFQSVSGTSQGAKMFVWMFDHIATLADLDQAKALYEQCGMAGPDVMHEEDRKEEEYKIVLDRAKCDNQLTFLFGLE